MPRVLPDLLTADDFPVQFGRYTLQGVVGEGGMARVYAAELRGPSGFTKPVALKIIRAGIASRGERLRRALITEAQIGGLLNHPNVVEVNDFGEVDGLPFIAMPLVRGVGLDQLLRAIPALPPGIALKIGLHMTSGLDHAHNIQAGDEELVHRDLKPSNVVISRHGVARILDFGIAKATSLSTDATDTGQTKGTPAYMSPEQVAGESLDRRSDIFALGGLLYEMLVGETMFGAASMVATLQQIVGVETHVLTSGKLEKVEAVLEGSSAVIHRCVRLDPDLRYRDATELEADLGALLDHAAPVPPLRVWVRDAIASHDLQRGSFDGTESVPSDARIPAVGQVMWKQAGAGGVGPTRAQVPTMAPAAQLPAEPIVPPAELAQTNPEGAPVVGPTPLEDAVPTDPNSPAIGATDLPQPAAMVNRTPLPNADSLPAVPRIARTDASVQPTSEAELQESFFGTEAVDRAAIEQAPAPPPPVDSGSPGVATTRQLPARSPAPMGHPPADEVGPTNRHPAVQPWQRTMLPVLLFALGLTLAVGGVAVVANSFLGGDQPAPSELALADLSDKQHQQRARDRVKAKERAQVLAAEREAEAAAATPTPAPAKKAKPRRSTRRTKKKAAPKATPTPPPTPTPEPVVSGVAMKASATILDRSGRDAKVLFNVRPEGRIDGAPTLHTRKPDAAWKARPMKSGRGGRYEATIRFTKVAGKSIDWYVTADGGAPTGSSNRPKTLRIR